VIATREGSRLYVTVGSNSKVAEKGMENETNRAAILEFDPATRRIRSLLCGHGLEKSRWWDYSAI
jgi:glucose/arabinose dehydrogenase